MKGLTYWLRNKMYVALTNECNSLSPLALRGPSFVMPPESKFQSLEREPTPVEIFAAVEKAFDDGKINVSSMNSDEVTFAGIGEPLLRLDALVESSKLIKLKRHGLPLRLKTNGLVSAKHGSQVY